MYIGAIYLAILTVISKRLFNFRNARVLRSLLGTSFLHVFEIALSGNDVLHLHAFPTLHLTSCVSLASEQGNTRLHAFAVFSLVLLSPLRGDHVSRILDTGVLSRVQRRSPLVGSYEEYAVGRTRLGVL